MLNMLVAVHLEGFPHNELRDIMAAFLSILNQPYNRCLGNSSSIDLLMLKIMLTWMLVQRVSGVGIGG